MSGATRIRVGVIGCGTIAQVMHLPYLRSLPERFEIAALSDVSPGLLDAIGAQYGVPADARYTDYRRLVEAPIDAVLVLTGGSHAPQVIAALEAGRHVLVEKPLCLTLREADQIADAARRTGRAVMVGYMKRFDPGFLHGKRLIDGLAEVRYVQINTLHPSEDQYLDMHGVQRFDDVPEAVSERAEKAQDELLEEAVGSVAGPLKFVYYDVFLGSMVHDVNALRTLFGEPAEVLFTEIWPVGSVTPSVTTVLRQGAGLRTTYTWSYLAEVRNYFEEIAVFSASERVRIQFPSPFLKNLPTPVVTEKMIAGARHESRIEVSYAEAFREELLAFHDCMTGSRPPRTGIADARADIAWLQRIFAASMPPGLGGEAARAKGPRE